MYGLSVMDCVQARPAGRAAENGYARSGYVCNRHAGYGYLANDSDGGLYAGNGYVYGNMAGAQARYIGISRCGRTGGRESLLSPGRQGRVCPGQESGGRGGEPGNRVPVGRPGNRRAARRDRRTSSPGWRLLLLAVVFTALLAGFRVMIRASSRPEEPTYKYYTTVTVGYGEDMTNIVYDHCDNGQYESADAFIREVCQINSLPYRAGAIPALQPGDKIVVPYYSTVRK